jgi:hypothetical protein
MLGLRNRDNGNDRVRPEVKDIQDEFLNIYRRVYDNTKDWASRFTEDRTPQTQRDADTIDSIQKQVENLTKVLTEKFNIIDSIAKGIAPATGIKSREIAQEFGKSYDIIKPYNEIIRSYLNPEINSKTRDEIKTNIQQIVPILNQIISTTRQALDLRYLRGPYLADAQRIAKKYMNPLITTYMVLLVIQKNLFRNTYSLIDKPQIDIQYNEWVSSFPENIRNFLTLIQNQSGEEFAEERRGQVRSQDRIKATDNIRNLDQKLAESIRLIEEDSGTPLSDGEKIRLRNILFGYSSRKFYSPEELSILEEEEKRNREFSDRRQEDLENLTTETQLRIRSGEQPVLITPEKPLPEPVGSMESEQITLMKREQTVEEITDRVQRFLDKSKEELKKNEFNIISPTKFTGGSDAVQQKRVKNARNAIIEIYKNGYELITRNKPSFPELEDLKTNSIDNQLDRNGVANLTDTSIEAGNPRSTLDKRTDIFNSIKNAYISMVASLTDTLNDAISRIESGEAVNLGRGKPRREASQAIHYDDYRNDPYLIR